MGDQTELHVAAYARALAAKKRSERTIQSYEEAVLQLRDFCGVDDVMDLEQADLEEFMTDLLGWAATTTAGIRFRSLRAFFNWAVREEIITKSPMARMSEPKADDEPVPIVADDGLKKLLKTCSGTSFEDRRDLAIIRLFCEPGSPRIAEMAGIELAKLDMRRSLVEVMGKGRKVRVIPIGVKCGQALDRYLRVRAKHVAAKLPHLWLGRRGMALTPSGIQQMLERRAEAAGIEHIRAHMLRHTSAHIWKEMGGSEEDAEALFGWTPGSGMAKRYGRSAAASRAEKAARKMTPGDRL